MRRVWELLRRVDEHAAAAAAAVVVVVLLLHPLVALSSPGVVSTRQKKACGGRQGQEQAQQAETHLLISLPRHVAAHLHLQRMADLYQNPVEMA